MNPSAFGKELINVAVLGLILLAAAGVLTAAVVTSNTDSLSVDLWGVSVTNVTLGVVFVAGMITTVLAVVGLGLLMGGMRRNRRLRQERRSLRRENEQLSQRVEAAPVADEPPPPGTTTPSATTARRSCTTTAPRSCTTTGPAPTPTGRTGRTRRRCSDDAPPAESGSRRALHAAAGGPGPHRLGAAQRLTR